MILVGCLGTSVAVLVAAIAYFSLSRKGQSGIILLRA